MIKGNEGALRLAKIESRKAFKNGSFTDTVASGDVCAGFTGAATSAPVIGVVTPVLSVGTRNNRVISSAGPRNFVEWIFH